MGRYIKTNNIIDAELAGCLLVLNNAANFKNLEGTIEQHIALCYTLTRARELVLEIEGEAEGFIIPFHEYVINELQYERRAGLVNGIDNLKADYEQKILTNWSRSLILRFGSEFIMNFLTLLNAYRAKRTR